MFIVFAKKDALLQLRFNIGQQYKSAVVFDKRPILNPFLNKWQKLYETTILLLWLQI